MKEIKMEKDILQIFNKLKKMEIDYGNNNLQKLYSNAISQNVFEKALSYDQLRGNSNNEKYTKFTNGKLFQGVFHLVLNVKVDANSPFMPFAFVTNTDTQRKKAAKKLIKSKQSEIKYNFTNFIDDLFEVNNKKAVESVSFKTSFNATGELQIDNFHVDDGRHISKDMVNPLICKIKAKGGFVNVLCNGYHNFNNECIANELYFNILSFDYDINSGHKLTHFLIISEDEEECNFFIEIRVRTLRDIVSVIRTRYISDISKKNLYESIKSAVSAIMSRNLSHNLGSHYLYYTKIALEKLADKGGNFGPHIRGAARVLSYIQSRMDYLATIVSNDKYPYGSVNFKSQILDELTIDDFSKRHYGTNQDADFKKGLEDSIFGIDTISEIVSELSSLYSECGRLNGEEFSKKRKEIDEKLSSLRLEISNIDTNSIYNRTTNYLLTNLIKSENYSRPNILELPETESFRNLYLYVRLWNDDINQYDLFTGSNNSLEMEMEKAIKDKLSKINLALPGGTMSCHAFYNILENFIRNSAKYYWTDNRPKDLKVTIALKVNNEKHLVECTIYDNKHDALRFKDGNHKRTLLDDIKFRLGHTRVLTDSHMIDKENKGLKEMLFSAVWLKANEFDMSFAEIITCMEELKPKQKLASIAQHAFEFVGVDDEGFISDDYTRANLGLRFVLPLFTHVESLQGKMISDLLKLHTDVVEVSDPSGVIPLLKRSYMQVFPRVCSSKSAINEQTAPYLVEQSDSLAEYESAIKLKQAIINNLGNIDQYTLRIATVTEPTLSKEVDEDSVNNHIFFDTHFSTQTTKSRLSEYYGKYVYIDTISGNNFTKTLQGLFLSGLSNKMIFKTYSDYYLNLKIKESGLTRITIIDERLFNSIRWTEDVENKLKDDTIPDECIIDIRATGAELSMKGIRVLNFLNGKDASRGNRCFKKVRDLQFLYGNEFLPLGPCKDFPNATHFLSIHLGLIEKLLKSKKLEKYIGERGKTPLSEVRIRNLMVLLEKTFGTGTKNGVHICVHSGRGNFSKELEGPLRNYPFLSLAALENAFNNSKFLLSQLFYNTIYIGKGEVNH